MKACFHDVDEFVTELERDAAGVANQRVRVTTLAVPVMGGTIKQVSIVAGAKVLSAVPGHEDFDLVEFRRHVGDLWGNPAADEEVVGRANELADELRQRLAELGFVVAAGMYVQPYPARVA